MVATFSRKRLILPMAPAAGAITGAFAAAIAALIPGDMLDRLILRSGLPAILAAAEPPLGLTARLVLILLGGGTIALFVWFALFLIVGSRTIALGGDAAVDADEDEAVPVLRRADAHPDAPSRRPVFANRDLGTPFLEVRAPQAAASDDLIEELIDEEEPVVSSLPSGIAPDAIPQDLDLPLSAFDPAAIRSAPMAEPAPQPAPGPDPETAAAPEAPVARPQIFEPGERFETFALSPAAPVTDPPPAVAAPVRAPRDTEATINALLERLERGVSDRAARPQAQQPTQLPPEAAQPIESEPSEPEPAPPPPEQGLERTLGLLRRMATRS